MSMLRVYIVLLITGLMGCASQAPVQITQWPIVFDEERKRLSLDYLRTRYGIVQSEPSIQPKMVVVHWTVVPTLEKTFEVFNPAVLPSSRENINAASALNVSAHFLVDRDGSIYQLLPTTTFARHTIGLNHSAIGIENIADGKALPLTQAQIQANIALIDYLAGQHQLEYVIGHHEYKQFIGHALWKEKDPNYLTEKNDPGDSNMQQIRAGLKKAKIKPVPKPAI
ncbi:peptidoglycan recognition protein family protein [Paraglaciecola aestuariivivens]